MRVASGRGGTDFPDMELAMVGIVPPPDCHRGGFTAAGLVEGAEMMLSGSDNRAVHSLGCPLAQPRGLIKSM